MAYIHPDSEIIDEFIKDNIPDRSDIRTVSGALLVWFDKNVAYSRLNAPFFPLQRSDLDVISMRSGTCGDYSNLIVSVLTRLGYEAGYAYVRKDCYGDEQDHICAAVKSGEEWILIDATLPYRKWHGYHCPHREYELLTPHAFEEKMKAEEDYWTQTADRYGSRLYAGLLYAPWIHERIVRQTATALESVFYLLLPDEKTDPSLYAYYLKYTEDSGSIPMMSLIKNGVRTYCFSCKKPDTIWNHEQWGKPYQKEDVPGRYRTTAFHAFEECVSKDLIEISSRILSALQNSAAPLQPVRF